MNSFISLDLEVAKTSEGKSRIFELGAVRSGTQETLFLSGKGLIQKLGELDQFAEGASFLLGQNIIAHDLKILQAANPSLKIFNLPVIDTLRLNPLAFPQNPYHSLIKDYHDGTIKHGQRNNPVLDAKLAIQVFEEQRQKLASTSSDLLTAWHLLCVLTPDGKDKALDWFFTQFRKARRPSFGEAVNCLNNLFAGKTCDTYAATLTQNIYRQGWELAYALAWLSVAGGNSVLANWVRHQFPQARRIVEQLRDTACNDLGCRWCREHHNAVKVLTRWFGFDSYRPKPVTHDNQPMQQAIVEAVMAKEHVFGILPTGTGKSLCYQVPALSRYYNSGSLTVVISPLVALMADQVSGLKEKNIDCCVTVNGMLSIPERADALERIRLGDAGIVLISPEQLRSASLVKAIKQRVIGGWVIDEAHCLSRWGHDFRPDYRYVGRFIGHHAGEEPIPPVLCLTATAKPDVAQDIKRYFQNELKIDLKFFDGGSERDNLHFAVVKSTGGNKFTDILQILDLHLPSELDGGAIVYCATRKKAEEIAHFLKQHGVSSDYFHSMLTPEKKKDVQAQFINGQLKTITATNAFGMGIDKPDVRLVIHADIPGSLENYLQEAGRAGRDGKEARCVLLFSKEDVENQFSLSRYSRLTRKDIHGVLRAIRSLNKKRVDYTVEVTAGEILENDSEGEIERDTNTDATRVRTAISWLEESKLLQRLENRVQVFPSSLRVHSIEEAYKKLETKNITNKHRGSLINIVQEIIEAPADQGISTDDLMNVSGLSPDKLRWALAQLESYGIATNETILTAYIKKGVQRSSEKQLINSMEVEQSLISAMRELAPDLDRGETSRLHLRHASQQLKDDGLDGVHPERLSRILRGIANDGRGEHDGLPGSLAVRKLDAERVNITLHREWDALERTATLRRDAATVLLDHWISRLEPKQKGVDLLAETTFGNLYKALDSDLVIKSESRNISKLLDRALLWLHEQEVIRLNKGLAVFRPAMKIVLDEDYKRGFSSIDFKPLELHYNNQTMQIHIMAEFAQLGLIDIRKAMHFSRDYFLIPEEQFLNRWMQDKKNEIQLLTTPESWYAIVESLNNPIQKRIVCQKGEKNTLVLAGPGSGKTRVLVHRIAWLIRVNGQKPRGIIALAFNRHAAVEIRQRLLALIGNDAKRVTVMTCHGLAMRLTGHCFSNQDEDPNSKQFNEVLVEATTLLKGYDGLLPEEIDEQRERILAGFRWIFVDEYQDITLEQYNLIAALAGLSSQDKDSKLTMFAVGDDDQNIYEFNGASVEYIRRFEQDYEATPSFLIENYRSTKNIIEASNAMIKPAQNRMKKNNPITINRDRKKEPDGGEWKKLDSIVQGRVQILEVEAHPIQQAYRVISEFLRLKQLDPDWDWKRCAIIARQWDLLEPAYAICDMYKIPVQRANTELQGFWRMRQTQQLYKWMKNYQSPAIDSQVVKKWINSRSDGGFDLLKQALEEYHYELQGKKIYTIHFLDWLVEWGRDIKRRQRGLLLLTAHRAKGLEFDHVAILDNGWIKGHVNQLSEAERRLYYVSMTRARKTLTLAKKRKSKLTLKELAKIPATNWQEAHEISPIPNEAKRLNKIAKLNEIDLSFAGRIKQKGVHQNITNLSTGERLHIQQSKKGYWDIQNYENKIVGRFAKSFKLPDGMRIHSASVYAILTWRRDDSESIHQKHIYYNEWEVVVPQFVLAPE